MITEDTEIGPKRNIEKTRLPMRKIAALADLDINTVRRARFHDKWPIQHRTRTALEKALNSILAKQKRESEAAKARETEAK